MMGCPLTDEPGKGFGIATEIASPPEWALLAAEEAFEICACAATRDKQIDAIARAIEFVANAATERAAVVAEQFSQSAHIAYSMLSGDFPKIARIEDAIAASIRKGSAHD